jgi:hypothetical protein
VLACLEALSSLTALTLGTMPLRSRAGAPLTPRARLPSVKRLHVVSPQWASLRPDTPERRRLVGLTGEHTLDWVHCLPALPQLESLTLDTAAVSDSALTALPTVAPPTLRELLLPPRLTAGAAGAAARSLWQLTALTRLRVGWQAAEHKGQPEQVRGDVYPSWLSHAPGAQLAALNTLGLNDTGHKARPMARLRPSLVLTPVLACGNTVMLPCPSPFQPGCWTARQRTPRL